MLRRNLTLALCSVGIMFSTAAWMILLAQPAHATGCNGSCGPDTGGCTGSTSYCSNYAFCNQSSCSGSFTSYANIVFQGTSNSAGIRTLGNPICTTTYTCGFVTVPNQVCSGIPFFKTCSPSVGPSCTKCSATNVVNNSPTNCTYVGPCNEG